MQAELKAKIDEAEGVLDDARDEYADNPTVANELATLVGEQVVTGLWASYMRAQGEIGQALKMIEVMAKLAGPIAVRRELLGVDMLAELRANADKDSSLDERTKAL